MDGMKGTNRCFNCGEKINWFVTANYGPGVPIAFDNLENRGEACAIGKEDNNTVFEITVDCKHCHTKNKFRYVDGLTEL